MKLVRLSVLLSIALLTSTVYLVMYQSSTVQNRSYDPINNCLWLDAALDGNDGLVFRFYHNKCYAHIRFTFVYNTQEGGPEQIFVSDCLNSNDQLHIGAQEIKSITDTNC